MTFLCVVTWLVGAVVLNEATRHLETKIVRNVDLESVDAASDRVERSLRTKQWVCGFAGTTLIVASMALAARNAGLL